MNTFIVIFALASVAFCKPVEVEDPSEIQQDVFGNFKFSSNDIAQQVHQLDDGSVVGSYSYIDNDGVLQRAEYTADDTGFHIAATNIPVAVYPTVVQDTPEVAAAKAKHLAEVEAIKQRNYARYQSDLAKQARKNVVIVEVPNNRVPVPVPAPAPAPVPAPVPVPVQIVSTPSRSVIVEAPSRNDQQTVVLTPIQYYPSYQPQYQNYVRYVTYK